MAKANKTYTAIPVLLITILGLSACKGGGLFNGKLFKERAAEKPAPHDQGIEKSFFVNADGKPKTFLCAWSPEMERGAGSESHLLTNMAMHCNIEFEITEKYLVGKMINPSFPNDRSRWKDALKIPIQSHYYFERQKDQHGRQTNEWLENSSRSHWSARPMIKLDLSSLNLMEFGGRSFGGGYSVTSVEDIEWDRQNNFLGFSMNLSFAGDYGSTDEHQGRFRVNFLKFDHDPSFQKVPYNLENSRYMNILHVMGRKVEGIEQELYAARWDLRKPTNLYINGVPEAQLKVILHAVEQWNVALREIGAIGPTQTAFVPVVKEMKHPFDLRYPALNWISDKRISLTSPLGIGMAHADVRNGKIIWGGVVIYGGLIENYVNRYAPVEAASAVNINGKAPSQAFAHIFEQHQLQGIPELAKIRSADQGAILNQLTGTMANITQAEIDQMTRQGKPEQAAALRERLSRINPSNIGYQNMVADLVGQAQRETKEVNAFLSRQSLLEMVGLKGQGELLNAAQIAERKGNKQMAAALKETDASVRHRKLVQANNQSSPFFMETDRTVLNMAGSWMSAEAQTKRNFPDMLDGVIADLTLHELGHFLGLGHQFKENILPEEGTVPSAIYNELKENATEEKYFSNYTSVMGYRSGRVEMAIVAKDMKPGPHDKLVLRYLYKGQYTVFDKKADEFLYAKVPASGKIPANSRVHTKRGAVEVLPTSYFPACNDMDASFDADPFCNRWDRGSSAQEIVASYFQLLSDNLLARLYSLVGGGSAHWMHESMLWGAAFDTFSRVRLFYDEMRRRLRSDAALIPLWNNIRNDKEALFGFADGCQNGSNIASLNELFKHKDIKDLCQANAIALREFRFFLNLPEGDYTRIDHTRRYISGGYLEGDVTRNYGGYLGAWFQLSNFPLKFIAMHTLTAANPYMLWHGWLVPNMFFDSPENRVLYRTLYPRDYTRLISDSVKNNMRFSATGMDDQTTMGRTILATSSLVPYQSHRANDSARLPDDFNRMLEQQTEFNLSMVAVIVDTVNPDVKSNVKPHRYKMFTGKIYDFVTGRTTAASDVFILPDGKLITRASGSFIFPVTKLKFLEGTTSYAVAYKIDYSYESNDKLVEESVKSALLEKQKQVLDACIEGYNRNGLANYFDNAQNEFEGFYIQPGIAEESGREKSDAFLNSIKEAFDKYEKISAKEIPPNSRFNSMLRVCDEASRGVGQITASAALLNGYWLNITKDYVEK